LIRCISRVRGVPSGCLVPAAGSSELIFLALRDWLTPKSRVLLVDPSYGEYMHVAERVIGCGVDRIALSRENNYQLDLALLQSHLLFGKYDLAVIVNPNSPTGGHACREKLQDVLSRVRPRTRVWIDETYVEYAGANQSLEQFAAGSRNVVVCKSMSKVYALSGLRAAYLCAPPTIATRMREISPPWAVSLPAQLAAVRALEDPEYYEARYCETHALRESLATGLRNLGLEVIPSVANFVLCHLPEKFPDAAEVAKRCREHGVYIRDAGEISARLGTRALRIAVKDEQSNRRILGTFRDMLG
jgi:histidinol-phosphate/aromatic aminotransferase/cobyric acid decarboxylase-like protein